MDSFQYSEAKQDVRGFSIDNKPVSFFPYPICGTVNLNPASAHGTFSTEESPLYATTEGTGNYVEMSSPTVATTPTATGDKHNNVLEQYISPTSNCSDRPYFSEEELNAAPHNQQEINQIEFQLGKALHCLQSERDKQYSEIENLKNQIYSLKADKSRSPQQHQLSQIQMSQQSSKLGGAVNLSRVTTHFRDEIQTPSNFPRQLDHSPRRPTLLTSLSTPGFESCASGQTYHPQQTQQGQHNHIKVMGEREEVDQRVLQPRDQNRPHNLLNESQTPAFGENVAPLLSSAKKYTETSESITQSPIPFKHAERFLLESTEGRELFEKVNQAQLQKVKIDFLEKENKQLHEKICALEVEHARKMDEKEGELRRHVKCIRKLETQQAHALESLHQAFSQLYVGIERVASTAKKDGKDFFTKKIVKKGTVPESEIDQTIQKKQYFLTLLEQLERYTRVRADERKALQRKYQDLSSVHASIVRLHHQKHSFDINSEIDRLRMENRRLKSDLQSAKENSDNLSEGKSLYCGTNSSCSNTPRCEKSCRSTSNRGGVAKRTSRGVEVQAAVVKDAKSARRMTERSHSPACAVVLPKKKKVTTVEMLAQKLERMEERMNQFATTSSTGFKKTKEVRNKSAIKKQPKTKSVQRRTLEDNRVSRCSSNSTLVPPISSIYPERSVNSLSEEDSEDGLLSRPLTSSIWSPEPPVLIDRHKSGAKTARKRSGSNSKGKKSGTRYYKYVDEMSDNTTLTTNISISHVKGKKHTPVRERHHPNERDRSGSCQRPACPGYREV